MTIDDIPAIASVRAEQLRTGRVPAPRVESHADGDIALLYGMVADLAVAVMDLVREQGWEK